MRTRRCEVITKLPKAGSHSIVLADLGYEDFLKFIFFAKKKVKSNYSDEQSPKVNAL